jgi:PEP-CTERM motif
VRPIPRFISVVVLLLGCCCAPQMAGASSISFQLSSTSLEASSGGTAIFMGTVTNATGGDLNASDFFFNFGNYDFAFISPTQDLGFPLDFPIPNGTTSPTVALFDVMLGAVPPGSVFAADVQLQDSNFDLTPSQTVTVSVPAAATTPEPATMLLFGTGLAGIWLRSRKSRARSGAVD